MADSLAGSTLHTLHRASGSATYISPTTSLPASPLTITCGVNFPVEVPRRADEIPTLLLIDVNVRPARGVGQVRERHVEALVRRTLGAVILREDWPRMACQIGLQVVAGEDEESEGSYLGLLAGCINAATLGCLDAGVPMRTVPGAVLVGLTDANQKVVMQPNVKERSKLTSLHVFAFGRFGECLLMESEGRCGLDDWEKAGTAARSAVLELQDGDQIMLDEEGTVDDASIMKMVRRSVEARIVRDDRWKDG